MNPLGRSPQELRKLDRQYLWHPFTHMKQWLADEQQPLIVAAAEGMYLIDSEGNRYLDGVSSLWCNVHGHRVPEIDAAIRAQLDKVAHTTMLGLANEPAILLAERLIKLAPKGLTKVFYSDAGATATEIAFKLAAQYWYNLGRAEKCEFVGFTEAYHGDTVGAMSIGRTTAFHKPYFPLLFKVHFAPTPHPYRWSDVESRDDPLFKGVVPASSALRVDPAATAASPSFGRANDMTRKKGVIPGSSPGRGDDARATQASPLQHVVREHALAALEDILRAHASRIAAVCIEPIVQGAAGMIVHPPGFLRGVRALCDKYDVLLIADEVAVGFGRTGRMFACEHENVSPDLMCVAKGISGGYLPLAATLATQKIFNAFLGEPWEGRTFFHGHTYTGNPLACAAALASLDLFEKNDLIRAVHRKSEALAGMLEPLKEMAHVGEIRQKGFMVGIELVTDKEMRRPFDPKRRVGAEICQKLRSHGVILRPLGDVIVLMPPLAMDVGDLRTIVDAVAAEVRELG
jgi:adenosylmethionine-8-amino-7-oxononanoate aminotransferase